MNTKHTHQLTGAQLLVEALKTHGTDHVFCVPGESYLAVLDALYEKRDAIRLITCRHEGGAANMAEAYGKLLGRPGICMVTRGPGATNASIGVHTAMQDSTPMILFVGQVSRNAKDREGFQEIDYSKLFGGIVKWAAEIESADRIAEYVNKAFQVACSGRPGPVVLALPEDMLTDAATFRAMRRYHEIQSSPSPEEILQLTNLLETAEKPLLILGGGGWNDLSCKQISSFAKLNDLPVACAFRFQDLIDNEHPNYIGDVGPGINPTLAREIKDSDLIVAIGPRLGEMTTSGYTLIESPVPKQRLIHVHSGAEELGSVFQAELMINSGMKNFAEALSLLPRLAKSQKRSEHLERVKSDYLKWISPVEIDSDVQMWDVIQDLQKIIPKNSIITNGAGNYTSWIHRFYRYGGFRTQLAPTSGAMGYGVPAAIAAKIVYPERVVISFSGDGCFLMNGQEIATAIHEKANVIFIVINNGIYGTIRMHQEREYPNRVIGTQLTNPNFSEYAKSFGAHGELVTQTHQFREALNRCLNCGKPSLIEIKINPEAITPSMTLSSIRNGNKV